MSFSPAGTYFRLIREFLWENKHISIAYIVMLILIPLQDVGIPHVIGKVIKTVRDKKFDFKYIYMLMALLLCGQIGVSINDFIESRLYPRLQTFTSEKVISYIVDTCKLNMQDILTGRFLAMMSNTPKTMYNFMDTWRSLLIPQFIVSVSAIIYFMYYQLVLGLILVVVLIFYYSLLFITIGRCGGKAMEREQFLLNVNEEIDDMFANMTAIFNTDKTQQEVERIKDFFKSYESFSINALQCTLKYKYMIVPVILVLGMLFLWVGFSMVQKGQLDLEKFVSMLLIFMYVFGAIVRSVNIIKDTAIRYGMIKQNMQIFNSLEPARYCPNGAPQHEHENTLIHFHDVSFAYKNKPIFEHLYLDINKGERVMIVGQIGKGKTTILKLIMRYQQPSNGTIYIQGTPIQNIPIAQLRKRIGFIPQNPILLNRTLYENITYGTQNISKQQVLDLIKELKLDRVFDENRLDTKVGKHGSKLSGGQRQVVWILRVLLLNPEIILMDEPTASIDNETKGFIYELFKRVMKDRTTIIVSHDMSMAQLCNRIISMS